MCYSVSDVSDVVEVMDCVLLCYAGGCEEWAQFRVSKFRSSWHSAWRHFEENFPGCPTNICAMTPGNTANNCGQSR